MEKSEWRFKPQEYLELFNSNLDIYAPIFGGFGANAMSEGKKVRGNPKIWRVYKKNFICFIQKKGRESWDADRDNKIELAIEFSKKLQFE